MYFNKKSLHKFQEIFFNLFITISWILITISAFGLSHKTQPFLEDIDYYIRIYICLFLIWRFHPFRTYYEFTDLDRKIVFSAGLFILTTTVLHEYLLQFIRTFKNLNI